MHKLPINSPFFLKKKKKKRDLKINNTTLMYINKPTKKKQNFLSS